MKKAKKVYTPEEMFDMEIPEVSMGSPFIRRGFVECLNNEVENGVHLTVGFVYRIEDVGQDGLFVNDDRGNMSIYPTDSFRSIDHGPFKVGDSVSIISAARAKIDKNTYNSDVNINEYVGGEYRIDKATATHATLILRNNSLIVTYPNESLKFKKRTQMLPPNPFKAGDKVRCIKDYKDHLNEGEMYAVRHIEDDFIYLKEMPDDRFRHNLFVKWDKQSKKQLFIKRLRSQMKLTDQVRFYINRKDIIKNKQHPVVALRKAMLSDKIIDEKVTLKEVKQIYDTMFHWK